MTIDVSKTFDFSPNLGELVLTAFGRISVRPPEITQTHMYLARQAANFILAEWSSLQPNLWEVGLQSIPLMTGSATYTVPAETVDILDTVIEYGTPPLQRVILPISRTEYMSYPNKAQQGFPTVFWFDRLISPQITFWPVPDNTFSYVCKYYSVRQTMDAELTNGLTVEVPYRFLEAYVAGLAWKLSEIYAPQLEDKMFARYDRAYNIAAGEDTEKVNLMLVPGISRYYR
jgi:hypothetical protein